MTEKLTYGLERDFVLGPRAFELETERIFLRDWVCVGHVGELFELSEKDQASRVRVGEYDLLVTRQGDGTVAAFHNQCSHRGTRLVTETTELKNSCVVCPYHAWTFNQSGDLIGAPNMNGHSGFRREDFGLQQVPCTTWAGFLMVNLDESANFGLDYAPIISLTQNWEFDKLELVDKIEYRVKANWKLLFQNYSECYHCPTVHPSLSRLTPYDSGTNDLTEGALLGGPMQLRKGVETVSCTGDFVSRPFDNLDEKQSRSIYFYTLFPSMFLSLHPDYVMVHRIERVSESETDVTCYFLVSEDRDDERMQSAMDRWDEINRQDWRVCELTQQGIESPAYKPGPYSNMETMLMAFDRHYRSIISD